MQIHWLASRQSCQILSSRWHRSSLQRDLSISAVGAALVVSDLSPWGSRAVVLGARLLVVWYSSPKVSQAGDGEAWGDHYQVAHHLCHSQLVARLAMRVSRGRGQACGDHDRQGQARVEGAQAMPCWAGDSMSRLQKSRAASIAVCSQVRTRDYVARSLMLPLQQVLLRTICLLCEVHSGRMISQVGEDPRFDLEVLKMEDLCGELRVARGSCGFQQCGSLPSAEEC